MSMHTSLMCALFYTTNLYYLLHYQALLTSPTDSFTVLYSISPTKRQGLTFFTRFFLLKWAGHLLVNGHEHDFMLRPPHGSAGLSRRCRGVAATPRSPWSKVTKAHNTVSCSTIFISHLSSICWWELGIGISHSNLNLLKYSPFPADC